jgi:uncharacterized protein
LLTKVGRGFISAIEDNPNTLLDKKTISLSDVIHLELLLEIDALATKFGENFKLFTTDKPILSDNIFNVKSISEAEEVIQIWQNAYEWTFYDQVLAGLTIENKQKEEPKNHSFQALFCIDDRECSIRRYVEHLDTIRKHLAHPDFLE